jgi:hypothetical protein
LAKELGMDDAGNIYRNIEELMDELSRRSSEWLSLPPEERSSYKHKAKTAAAEKLAPA